MAAPYNPPVKNQDFIIGIKLPAIDDDSSFAVDPTIETGDVTVEKNFGATANISTLPTVLPAGGTTVKLTLSATEFNTDNVVVTFIDQTDPKEWADFSISIPTTSA
jgi:hypothetical protein